MQKQLLLALALTCAVVTQAHGKDTHVFITGPLQSGPEVTKTCIGCHEDVTKQFMKTVHWTWGKKQSINGKSVEYGKKNAIGNSFCFALPSNWPACTSCHAGYGWADGSFDFSKPENIDCLVCHETTGTYKKFPSAAGHPVYAGESKEFPKGMVWAPADLVSVAQSVDLPNRTACGACHFYSGGGDNAKHGDLDSTLSNPTPEVDIHMGGKAKLTCESCHQAANHDVRGEAISVSPGSGAPRAFGCGDCHKGKIHKSVALNNHIPRVACQTCHIPTYAKATPTVMSWDWSTAGKETKADPPKDPKAQPKDAKEGKNAKQEPAQQETQGDRVYDKVKGDLVLGKNMVPTYLWYNGTVDRLMVGDKIDPGKVVHLSFPRGDRKDPQSRIFPFKLMTGRQPYDMVNKTLAIPQIYGPEESETAYSVKFDWKKAIEAGMKAAGQPFSGKYGWVDTSMVWSLNHMVAPKEKALRCPDCHVENGLLNWKALGYPNGDPR